jgi:hypothetical protein
VCEHAIAPFVALNARSGSKRLKFFKEAFHSWQPRKKQPRKRRKSSRVAEPSLREITRENSYDGCSSEHPFLLLQFSISAHFNQPLPLCLTLNIKTTDPVSGELFCARKQGIFLLQRMRHAETSSKKTCIVE